MERKPDGNHSKLYIRRKPFRSHKQVGRTEWGERNSEKAIIIGRFQPFHNGHLNFIREIEERYEFLTIFAGELFAFEDGTARRSMHDTFRSMLHRYRRDFMDPNPFSYEERKAMMEGSLMQAGIGRESFAIKPTSLKAILQTDGTICLRGQNTEFYYKHLGATFLGRKVKVIGSKSEVSGREIRASLRSREPIQDLVPEAALKVIQRRFGQAHERGILVRV